MRVGRLLNGRNCVLIEHNCPVDCVARDYHQACEHELKLYEDVLGVPLVREEIISEGGTCCRYRIGAEWSSCARRYVSLRTCAIKNRSTWGRIACDRGDFLNSVVHSQPNA